jgi:hypothetical protein
MAPLHYVCFLLGVIALTDPVQPACHFSRIALFASKISPSISKSDYDTFPLYNSKPGKVHIVDLVQIDDKYMHRMSDRVTGMLIVGAACRIIRKTQACYFCVPLLPHVSLRKIYKYEGEAFLGQDSRAMTLHSQVFSGSKNIAAGIYYLDNVETASNYDEWLSNTLFHGKKEDECDYKHHGLLPPKQNIDGTALTD